MRNLWLLSGVVPAALATAVLALAVACGGEAGPSDGAGQGEALATPVPTPTPTPLPVAHCYRPRYVGSDLPPETMGLGTTAPPETPYVLRPAGPGSVFQSCQVVSYYGYPDTPVMGALGAGTPAEVVEPLLDQATAYDDANGPRGVAPAFHLIYAAAQAYDTSDGTYLARLPDDVVREYLDVAEREDLLLFLDIQMGHSNVTAELEYVLPYLRSPRVHLALDPEFAMPPGVPPGEAIGGLDATEINRAQQALQALVEAEGLPDKILVVHQFTPGMIPNKQALQAFPNVNLVIDMDGFGPPGPKMYHYELFIKDDGAEHGGFKLFYDHDPDLMPPADVATLVPQPDVVIYQ